MKKSGVRDRLLGTVQARRRGVEIPVLAFLVLCSAAAKTAVALPRAFEASGSVIIEMQGKAEEYRWSYAAFESDHAFRVATGDPQGYAAAFSVSDVRADGGFGESVLQQQSGGTLSLHQMLGSQGPGLLREILPIHRIWRSTSIRKLCEQPGGRLECSTEVAPDGTELLRVGFVPVLLQEAGARVEMQLVEEYLSSGGSLMSYTVVREIAADGWRHTDASGEAHPPYLLDGSLPSRMEVTLFAVEDPENKLVIAKATALVEQAAMIEDRSAFDARVTAILSGLPERIEEGSSALPAPAERGSNLRTWLLVLGSLAIAVGATLHIVRWRKD